MFDKSFAKGEERTGGADATKRPNLIETANGITYGFDCSWKRFATLPGKPLSL